MRRALLLVPLLLVCGSSSQARVHGGEPVALVTAETLDQLIAVDLPSGHVRGRIRVPAQPENVEVGARFAVVVSTRGRAVTIVDAWKLRVRAVLHGFGAPHIVALSPDRRLAYVTDDARGQLVVVSPAQGRVVGHVFVGLGAHHLAISPDGARVWVALGERARKIVVVDTSRPRHLVVVGAVDPRGAAHDLAFEPDGRRVWITYDDRRLVRIFDAGTRRPVASLAADAPPQHVAFSQFELASHPPGRLAYISSGYGRAIRVVSVRELRTLRRVRVPYGSFNVVTAGGLVATSSLLTGTLTELTATPPWQLLEQKHLAPAARDVAIAVLP